jgi:putative membrane protein
MRSITTLRRAALVLGALLLGACSKGSDKAADTAGVTGTATPSTAPAPDTTAAADTAKLTDANILAKEAGGDSSEVQIATMARDKATSPAVKSYAEMLISDHSKALDEGHKLAKKIDVAPQAPANDTTAQMTTHVLDRLRSIAKGAAFDTAFVNHEVEDHQHDIQEAHEMAAAAQKPEVKDAVQKSLPVLEKHLKRAQDLQKTTKG